MIEVTFQSLGRSGRIWTAVFDLGSPEANGIKALEAAWKHNARILNSAAVGSIKPLVDVAA